MNPNFTQIQGSCDSLKEWQYSDVFQPILNEVVIKLRSNNRITQLFRQLLHLSDPHCKTLLTITLALTSMDIIRSGAKYVVCS